MSNQPSHFGNVPQYNVHPHQQQHQQQQHHLQEPERRPYSYLHTPVALQGPTFPAAELSSQTAPAEQTTNQQSHSQPSQPGSHRPFSYVSPDADREGDESLSTVSNNRNDVDYVNNLYGHVSPPPLSEHPAQFAPFADNTTPPPQPHQLQHSQEQEYHHQQEQEQEYQRQQQYLQQHQQLQQQQHGVVPHSPMAVPLSPGPLPVKHNIEAEARERQAEEAAIVPDSNPLAPQSPAPTYASHSSPPQRISTRGISAVPDIPCHTPGQSFHHQQGVKGGSWTNGLCECSDIGVCCLGLWCPCILYGRTQHRLSRKSKRQDPTNMLGYETCNASCTAMALLCGCQWLLATIQHTRTRRAYGIPGGIMSDCVRASCCTCCTLIQDEREIKAREEFSRTGGGNTVSVPYAAPGHMTFSPPPR
ncbi:hypothetical protein FQN49_006429 [Arthroderma sp. PD_2]|nr:hypothetical protein FQN49_006429 [Arthroderma sp. PD_2]